MKTIKFVLLMIVLNSVTVIAQKHYLIITTDTIIPDKIKLSKGEIYQGHVDDLSRNHYILIGRDSIIYRKSDLFIVKNDFTEKKLNIVRKADKGYYFISIPSEAFKTQDTCYLYNSHNKKARYFTSDFNEKVIPVKELGSCFKLVIPKTPVLVYFSSDKFNSYVPQQLAKKKYIYYKGQDGKGTVVMDKKDKSVAFLLIKEPDLLEKIDPSQDSVLNLENSGTISFNKDLQTWVIDKKSNLSFILIIVLAVILIGLFAIWYFIFKRIPVYSAFMQGSIKQFAADNDTSVKFIVKANKEFNGLNLENIVAKNKLKEELLGKYLIVGDKYKLSRNKNTPVFIRYKFIDKDDNLTSFINSVKIKEQDLQKLNPELFNSNNKKKEDHVDILVGEIKKTQKPGNLSELLGSLEISSVPANDAGNFAVVKEVPIVDYAQTKRMQGFKEGEMNETIPQKNLVDFLDTFSTTISHNLDKLENRINSIDQAIHEINEKTIQNTTTPGVSLVFYSIEAANASSCISRLQTFEKEIIGFINSLKIKSTDMISFIYSCTNRFLQGQVAIREKVSYWKPLLEACTKKMALNIDDLTYKNILEDIIQFDSDEGKSVLINRKLLNDIWENCFSNLLILCEELRNAKLFLNKNKPDKGIFSEIEFFSEKYTQLILDTAKTMDFSILYIPLFAMYENFNLRDLDVDSYTNFDYFYDQMKGQLGKNSVVQVISYGIKAPKIERFTKTKIKILS